MHSALRNEPFLASGLHRAGDWSTSNLVNPILPSCLFLCHPCNHFATSYRNYIELHLARCRPTMAPYAMLDRRCYDSNRPSSILGKPSQPRFSPFFLFLSRPISPKN